MLTGRLLSLAELASSLMSGGPWLRSFALERLARHTNTSAMDAWLFIASERALLKVELLATNPELHAEVDRPDAEVAFRFAIVPPLLVICIYLAAAVRFLWLFALLFLAALVLQGTRLRDQADEALAIALRAVAGKQAVDSLRRRGP